MTKQKRKRKPRIRPEDQPVGWLPPLDTDRLDRLWHDAAIPPKKLSLWQWAEANIMIPRRSGTPHPGPYRTSVTPWVRGWFDLIQDQNVHTVALETAAQVSKTTTCLIALCYWMAEDPDPILYAMPSEDLASGLSANRLMPMIEESPLLRERLTGDRYDMTALEYRTKETVVRFIGLMSPGKTASFPHRYIIVDEPDKILRDTIGREGGVLGLVFARARQFWNRKRLIVCTPTTAAGYIHKYFLLGDQRRYFVPCPFCGHRQLLVWPQVRFDSKLPADKAGKSAWYECVNGECKGRILDAHRFGMVANGEWRATAEPNRPGYASAHLSSLYSNSDECSFTALVEKFMSVKDVPPDLREFVNQDLAELWEEQPKAAIQRGAIWDIRDRHRFARAVIPTSLPVVLVLVCDVQAKHIPFTVWAMRLHDLWLIDHGNTSTLDDIKAMLSVVYKRTSSLIPTPSTPSPSYISPSLASQGATITVQMLDTGYRTMEVYDYCLNALITTVPIKGDSGSTTSQSAPVRTQKIASYPNGKPMPRGRTILLRHLHPMFFRDGLMDALKKITPAEGQSMEQAVAALPVRMWFHEQIDGEFVDQVTGEVLIEEEPNKQGVAKRYYKKLRTNDFFDCCHYALALRYLLRPTLVALERPDKGPRMPLEGDETEKTGVDIPPDVSGAWRGDKRDKRVILPKGVRHDTTGRGDGWSGWGEEEDA